MSKTKAGTVEAADRTKPYLSQVGFQRCGATALAAFFERCGIPAVHYDEGRLAKRMRVNIEAGARPPARACPVGAAPRQGSTKMAALTAQTVANRRPR